MNEPTSSICGYDRKLVFNRLITAQLRDQGLDVDGNAAYRQKLLIARGYDAAKINQGAQKSAAIDAALYDLSSLVEMLLSEAKRLQIEFSNVDQSTDLIVIRDVFIHGTCALSGCLYIHASQIRSLFSRWVYLSDGSSEEAAKIICDR